MLALAAALVGFVPAGRPLRRCPDQRASRIACAADDAPDGADFRASLENIFVQSAADEDAPPGAAQLEGELFRNLPLWRVQWAASPGGSQVYNVHVPHYTHMFTTLVGHARLEPQPSRQGPTQSLLLTRVSLALDRTPPEPPSVCPASSATCCCREARPALATPRTPSRRAAPRRWWAW